MADYTRFTSIEYAGKNYPVTVNHSGIFHAHEPQITAEFKHTNVLATGRDLDELRQALVRKIRSQSGGVAIRFCVIENYKVRYGVARGIHAKSEDILVTWEDTRERDTLKSYTRDTLRPLTKEEYEKVTELGARVRAVKDAWTTLDREFITLIAPFKQSTREERLDVQIRKVIADRIAAEDAAGNVVPLPAKDA